MIQQHPREAIVRAAEAKIRAVFMEALDDLTDAEQIRVVSGAAHEWLGVIAKYAIREERHGDHNTPGGLAAAKSIPEEKAGG